MVPTLTCGLVRSNFFLAMSFSGADFFPEGRLRGAHHGDPEYGAHDRDRTGEPLPYQGSALPTELRGPWSGKRDSNPQPSAWKADALAIELFPPTPTDGGEGRIRTSEGCA